MVNNQGMCANSAVGPSLGGLTPQVARVHEIMDLMSGLNEQQLHSVHQQLQDRFVTLQQRRGIPEVFGDGLGRATNGSFMSPQPFDVLPGFGVQSTSGSGNQQLDVFSKSEKWLTPAPAPAGSWKNREEEVLGWAGYLDELSSWAAGGSLEFSVEIQHSSRWPCAIRWSALNSAQQSRSRRLMSILRAAFHENPRCVALINAFGEGVALHSVGSGDRMDVAVNQQSNGYELLRQLTLEFSIRSRAEALSLRTQIAGRSFVLSAAQTSPSSLVSDVIRKVDYEAARFSRLLGTLPMHVDTTGLRLADSDLLVVLLRSLPESVKNYILHHSSGDTYESYRNAAMRWEEQQRLFSDFEVGGKKVNAVSPDAGTTEGTEYYSIDEEWGVDAVQGDRCSKCGSRKHTSVECTVDLSKTKCFKCGNFGHVSQNCPSRSGRGSKGSGGKGQEKGKKGVIKSDAWGKKGKGTKGTTGMKGGKGKKGKLNEVSEEWTADWTDWSNAGWDGQDYWWHGDGSSWDSWYSQVEQTQWNGNDMDWQSGQWQQSSQGGDGAGNAESLTVGSLIISPLLHDYSAFGVGSFVFENEDPSSPEERVNKQNHQTQESVEFELSDVAHADHEVENMAWFCGLKHELDSGLQLTESLSHDLCVPVPRRVVLLERREWFDDLSELSIEQQMEPYLEYLRPLLSQVADNTDASWWLLDSGASTSVLAESNLSAFKSVLQNNSDLGGYRAANGSSVQMSGTTEVGVQMHMSGTSGDAQCWKKARLKVLVGSIRHNILSVTSLADSGWRFTQGPKGFDLFHERLGMHCLEVAYFANCPWVRLHPDVGVGSTVYRSDLNMSSSHDLSVCTVTGGDDSELAQHRRQGHIPFNPNCLECAKGRSVFQHRRDKGDRKEVSIQADFAFINTTGEIVADDLPNSVKVLVLTEMMSRCIGYVVVGEDLEATRRQIVAWLQHFGLTSKAVSVDVRTDSEKAVGDLIGHSTGRYTFSIRRAAPQQHRTVGAAERTVRELKESFSILRSDLNAQGLDLVFSYDTLTDALTYLALCNNHFSTSRGSDRSPLDMVAGRKLSKPVSTLFGAQVLAEIPDSIRKHSPLSTRNVECTFIHTGLERGPVVQGLIRVGDKTELMRFVARNVRAITPLRWELISGQGVLTRFENACVGSGPQVVHDSGCVPLDISDLPPDERRKLKSQDLPSSVQPRLVSSEPSRHSKRQGELKLAPSPVPNTRQLEERTRVDPQQVVPSVSPSPTSPDETVVSVPKPVGARNVAPKFTPTRRCPACESGMNVPGVRHNKECKKRLLDFENSQIKERRVQLDGNPATLETAFPSPLPMPELPEVEMSGASPSGSAQPQVVGTDAPGSAQRGTDTRDEYVHRFKRKADSTREELERELREETDDMIQSSLDFDWFWVGNGEPVFVASLDVLEGPASFVPATSPDMCSGSCDAIFFDRNKEHDFVRMPLGGKEILVWKPDGIVDDQDLRELDLEQGFQGMQEEIRNLEHCKTGRIITQSELEDMKIKVPNLRLIQSRWVAAFKSSERVRTRIVAKDYNRGATARSLGFSSPTPSIESVHLVLAMASTRKMRLRGLDVGHAFMHSPLGPGIHVVLKMPLSVSFPSGEPTFLVLDKALNGLRDASLAWLQLLTVTVEDVGLWSDSLEPCVYGGQIMRDGHELGFCLAVVYVDDILLLSTTQEAEDHVVDVLSSVVPVKTTGVIGDEGGSLTFIGRVIKREKDSSEITLGVDPHYLDTTFVAYGITRGSDHVPDIAGHLERTLTDANFRKPLSDEAYSRFRKALGKLLWMSQVRHDIKTWMSLLGSQQASPMHGTEQALKAVLRFLYGDMHACLCLPSRDETIMSQVDDVQLRTVHLHAFCDASHAPYRFNNRRGVSGGVVFFERSLVRSLSRQQQALSLSSCEAELYGLQSVCQESVAFGKLVHRLLFALHEIDEPEEVVVWLESDSSSALQLVRALDVPRRSRHVEIRLHWLRDQLRDGFLKLKHRSGVENPADLFTKCLSAKTFFKHRFALGIVIPDGLTAELSELRELCVLQQSMSQGSSIAVVELCCSEHSNLKKVCEVSKVPYIGVVAKVQSSGTLSRVRVCIQQWKNSSCAPWVHIHASTPCSSGSPLRNFNSDVVTEKDQEWIEIINAIGGYFKSADSCSFELPERNDIWSRAEALQLFENNNMKHAGLVKLCNTGVKTNGGIPVGKTLKFLSNSQKFANNLHSKLSTCTCEKHAQIGEINYTETAFYNRKLARYVLTAIRHAAKR